MKKSDKKINKFARLHTHILPVLIWGLAAATTVVLFVDRSKTYEYVGIAQTEPYYVIAGGAGRLTSMPVDLFQEVKSGETIAVIQLNTAIGDESLGELLLAQRATAEAELERLAAELESVSERLKSEDADRENEAISTHRRLALDVEQARLEQLRLNTVIKPDEILQKDIELEIKLTKDLIEKGAAESYALEKLTLQYDMLVKKLEEHNNLLAIAESNFDQAKLRLDEFTSRQTAPLSHILLLKPLAKAIIVQENRIKELDHQRATIAMASPFDGVVSMIQCRNNQTVMAGDPILTIVKSEPKDVMVYASPDKLEGLFVNKEVEIVKKSTPQKIAKSQITHLGPAVEMIPERLWKSPDIPEYGLPVRIACNPELNLLPNELVGVRGL